MISNAAAYYHWPAIWVGDAPHTSGVEINLAALGDEVCRTTLPGPLEAQVLREGRFVFDFSAWPPGRALEAGPDGVDRDFDAAARVILRRVELMNAHLVCLYTAIARRQQYHVGKMVLAPRDLISMRSMDEEGGSFGEGWVGALSMSRYPTTYALPPMADWRVMARYPVVEIETVAESFRILSAVLQHPGEQTLPLVALLAHSCKAFEDHDYSLCLVTAWTIAERLLWARWEEYLRANRTREVNGEAVAFVNRDRMKKLLDGRDFTASVVSEILSLMDLLPYSLYRDLASVRGRRNAFLHGLGQVARQDAECAVRVAEEMLRLVTGIDMLVPLQSAIHQ